MNEQKQIKHRLIKNMILNFITFTIIFSIFDLIIYNQVSHSLYKTIDAELIITKQQYERQEQIKSQRQSKQSTKQNDNKSINPRLVTIVRNTSFEITNKDSIGRFYEDYIQEVPFNSDILDKIYEIGINNQYKYRCYNFKTVNANGDIVYVQLLANVDGEVQTLNAIWKTLIIGSSGIIVITIIASYLLSKQTIKPIIESWKKQTEFVQNASHELRTPLTIIQTKQELLLQNPNKKIIEKSEDINISLKETKRLSKLIKELMILARSDSNRYELNKENTNIDNLIKEVSIPYIDFASSQDKNIELDLNYKKEIKIDSSKINQLLIIILDNAIKYTTENDNIKISTYLKDGKCNIEITDTGIGISDEGLKYIFDRFYREDKARSRETGGNGLGLSIAKTIVESHGGTIKIIHNKPKGTRILIKI